ncbi:AfsR/SARP family transcriptional regulator [Streptomyces sp. AHA2]|uniref:AfsR/SARP family transcriptional regulator n=1 Tax=Streptomyces sp. AHA2 TaxID=3064526 RepID=UPI002FE192F1
MTAASPAQVPASGPAPSPAQGTAADADADAGQRTSGQYEFRLPGPVELYHGPTHTLLVPPGSKQRALLSALVLHAGRFLTTDRITEELSDRRPPANPANALRAHIARLRRLLPRTSGHRSGQGQGQGHEWIHTRSAGYLLDLDGATTPCPRHT